jgi:hypothetical protein
MEAEKPREHFRPFEEMTIDDAPRCGTCRFALAVELAKKQGPAGAGVDLSQPRLYTCRRYPPSLVLPVGNGSVAPQWPNMLESMWCGEYTADPRKAN